MEESTPVYNAVPTTEPINDAPPKYNLVSQLRQAKANSTGPVDAISSSFQLICGSFILTACMGLSSILPIVQLIIAVPRQEECTIQPMLPKWLIVSGACGLAYSVINAFIRLIDFLKKRKNPNSNSKSLSCVQCILQLLGLFCFGWFIYGNYLVYSIYSEVQYNTLTNPATYCNKLLYLFSFWSITASWILCAGICFLTCICCVCIIGFCAAKD